MKILSLLTQSKEEKAKKAAERAARTLRRGQEALIDKLEAEKDKLTDKQESLLNLSGKSVPANWNEDFQNATVELSLIEKKIEIANATLEEYFTEDKAEA